MDLTPQIIGDPTGRKAGFAQAESGQRFEVFEPQNEFDLSPEFAERGKFKNFLYEKYNLPTTRPHMSESEISDRINSMTMTNERGLWEHVFGDQARYEDRKHLSTKSQSAWKDALLKMRKNVDRQVKTELKSQQEQYEYKKGMIDEEIKAYDDYIKIYEKPEKPAKPTKAKYKQILDMVKKINAEGRNPTSSEMLIFEKLTEGTDIKVEDIITQEAEKKGLLGIDYLWPDVPEKGALQIRPRELLPETQRKSDETIEQYLKRTGK